MSNIAYLQNQISECREKIAELKRKYEAVNDFHRGIAAQEEDFHAMVEHRRGLAERARSMVGVRSAQGYAERISQYSCDEMSRGVVECFRSAFEEARNSIAKLEGEIEELRRRIQMLEDQIEQERQREREEREREQRQRELERKRALEQTA